MKNQQVRCFTKFDVKKIQPGDVVVSRYSALYLFHNIGCLGLDSELSVIDEKQLLIVLQLDDKKTHRTNMCQVLSKYFVGWVFCHDIKKI